MSELTFRRGEKLSAEKMNQLASNVASGSSNAGGLRSRDGVTPINIRDRKLNETRKIYEATSNAAWDTLEYDDPVWLVNAKRVKIDGTLDATTGSFRCIGISTDDPPVLIGDRCIELTTADGWKVLVPLTSYAYNHSFKPTQVTETTFDITQGIVRVGTEGTATLPETETNISFETNTHFQIKIDWSSVNFRSPVITWEAGVAFGTNTDTILYYPILQFGTAGEWSTLIRRQTSDIHAPNYPIPELTADTPAILVFNGTALVWVSATQDYSVFQRKADDSLGFDYVRVMA